MEQEYLQIVEDFYSLISKINYCKAHVDGVVWWGRVWEVIFLPTPKLQD